MTTKVGTLRYELACVQAFLEIPGYVKRDVGRDEVWELVCEAVQQGVKVRLVDYEFRDLVKQMMDAQMAVRSAKGRSERDAAIPQARHLEDKVREILREDE
jgi:hypothetical protein